MYEKTYVGFIFDYLETLYYKAPKVLSISAGDFIV